MLRSALSILLLLGCGVPWERPSDAGPLAVTSCLDDATLRRCADGVCDTQACRGDELCSDDTCVPWTDAELRLDFDLERADGRSIAVRVHPGGFPRSQVEALRFDFGDGAAGYGESLRHRYAEDGAYRVDLDVRLRGYRTLHASHLAKIDPPDDAPRFALTVNRIEPMMNGSVPLTRDRDTPDDPSDDITEAFHLLVPQRGFYVDLTWLSDAPPNVTLDTDPPTVSDLNARVDFEHGRASVRVDDASLGMLTVRADDGLSTQTLEVEVVELPTERDPFDRPMRWLLVTDRDYFSTQRSGAENAFSLVTELHANGANDFLEELRLLGAQGPDEIANLRYLSWIKRYIRQEIYRIYGIAPDGTPRDGIGLTIHWEGEADAPDPAEFRPEGDFSMIRLGGTLGAFLGFSEISPYNELRIDDTPSERGIATATLLGILTSTPVATEALSPIKVGIGQPVGTHLADAVALDPEFDPYGAAQDEVRSRHETLDRIARYLGLAIATVTAHEMGHAMGLMPNGVPPAGFFGNSGDVTFVDRARTDPFHADLPGINLMQSGGNYLGVIDSLAETVELGRVTDLVALAEILALETRLSSLSRAYLQGRLTYADDGAMASGLALGCR